MGIAISATRFHEDRKHEEIDIGIDPDSGRHMGGRANHIHNHKFNNDDAVDVGAGDRAIVADGNFDNHAQHLDHAELVQLADEQLPSGHGAEHERELYRIDD